MQIIVYWAPEKIKFAWKSGFYFKNMTSKSKKKNSEEKKQKMRLLGSKKKFKEGTKT